MSPPSLATAGLVLLLLYLTGRFLWLYNKNAAQAQAATASSSSASQRPPAVAAGAASSSLPAAASTLPRCAVPMSSSSLLPVFFVLHVAVPRFGGERTECAVCLAEFGEREAARLLPWCGHAFHEECIATWLRVSATCPLCRASVATK